MGNRNYAVDPASRSQSRQTPSRTSRAWKRIRAVFFKQENRHPSKDVTEETAAQDTCREETGASSKWVTIELGATSQDIEVGMSHLQSGAVSGGLKEPQQQSDTVKELQCGGKGKDLESAAECIDAVHETMSCLTDTERELNILCLELGLEDVCAIMHEEMDVANLFMKFPINLFYTVQKKLDKLEQKVQEYNSECSKLSALLVMIDTKLACLENCKAAMFKRQFPAFDHVSGDEEMRQINLKLKKLDKKFKSVKAFQIQIKKRLERELKEKLQKKEEIEMLCACVRETKEVLHAQIAAVKNYATLALEVHVHTLGKCKGRVLKRSDCAAHKQDKGHQNLKK